MTHTHYTQIQIWTLPGFGSRSSSFNSLASDSSKHAWKNNVMMTIEMFVRRWCLTDKTRWQRVWQNHQQVWVDLLSLIHWFNMLHSFRCCKHVQPWTKRPKDKLRKQNSNSVGPKDAQLYVRHLCIIHLKHVFDCAFRNIQLEKNNCFVVWSFHDPQWQQSLETCSHQNGIDPIKLSLFVSFTFDTTHA